MDNQLLPAILGGVVLYPHMKIPFTKLFIEHIHEFILIDVSALDDLLHETHVR